MNRMQRVIVIVFALADLLVLCALGVLAFTRISGGNTQAVVVQPTAVVVTTPRPPTVFATVLSVTPTNVLSTPTAKPVPTVKLDTGWKYYDNSEGFRLALPPKWDQLPVAQKGFQATMDTLKKNNPDLANALGSQSSQLLSSGFKFFGFDLGQKNPKFLTNVNILIEPLTVAIPLDTYVDLSLAQLEKVQSVSKPVNHRRVQLAVGDAEELTYHLKINSAQGNLTTMTMQYLVVREYNAYIITFTTTDDQANNYTTTFQKIAQTFVFAK